MSSSTGSPSRVGVRGVQRAGRWAIGAVLCCAVARAARTDGVQASLFDLQLGALGGWLAGGAAGWPFLLHPQAGRGSWRAPAAGREGPRAASPHALPPPRFVPSGIESLLDEQAVVVGGTNHSHATKDLYDAISAGDYPGGWLEG